MWYKLKIGDSNLWLQGAVLSLTTCSQIGKRLLMQGARGQVDPKGLPMLFELYYLKSILLSYVIKLYYLKSCMVTLRHCREKEQLVELYIKVSIIV